MIFGNHLGDRKAKTCSPGVLMTAGGINAIKTIKKMD
jgi:hypothetical protein